MGSSKRKSLNKKGSIKDLEQKLDKFLVDMRYAAETGLKKAADRIANVAKQMAPEDTGSLADAIMVEKGSQSTGKGGRKTKSVGWYIFVKGDIEVPTRGSKTKYVRDYAMEIHEKMVLVGEELDAAGKEYPPVPPRSDGKRLPPPYYLPGNLSRIKQSHVTVPVGGHFMTRAVEYCRELIKDDIVDILKDMTRDLGLWDRRKIKIINALKSKEK